jgi:hypothetical protein
MVDKWTKGGDNGAGKNEGGPSRTEKREGSKSGK